MFDVQHPVINALPKVPEVETVRELKRLTGRVQAARTLERAKDPGGLGFALDTVLAFVDGKEKSTLTGGATVMVAAHNDGVARPSICLLWMIARRWARPSAPFTGCDRISCSRIVSGILHRADSRPADRLDQAAAAGGPCAAGNHVELGPDHRDGGPVVVRHLRCMAGSRMATSVFQRDHHRGDELAEHAGQRSGTRSRVDFRQA